MASLPLSVRKGPGDAGGVSKTGNPSNDHQTRTSALSRLAWRIAAVLVECHQAARRSTELRMSADMYIEHPEKAPETYPEFLFRTSGSLRHEPPARKRART